jgi:hypothetical protein
MVAMIDRGGCAVPFAVFYYTEFLRLINFLLSILWIYLINLRDLYLKKFKSLITHYTTNINYLLLISFTLKGIIIR